MICLLPLGYAYPRCIKIFIDCLCRIGIPQSIVFRHITESAGRAWHYKANAIAKSWHIIIMQALKALADPLGLDLRNLCNRADTAHNRSARCSASKGIGMIC